MSQIPHPPNPATGIPPYTIAPRKSPSAFLGFPAMQNRNAVPCWSYLAEIDPPARIIELGTYEGGFSVLMAIMAKRLGVPFYTYDINRHPENENWFFMFGVNRIQANIFSDEVVAQISQTITLPGVTWLLCDNGDKQREWKTFAPVMKPGDIIGAHDYCEDPEFWCCREFDAVAALPITQENRLRQVTVPEFTSAAWYVCRKESV